MDGLVSARTSLVEDVKRDGQEQNQSLNSLLPRCVNGENRETHVEHTHDETTDNGPDNGTNATLNRSSTNEDGSDRVELVVSAGRGDRSACAGGRDDTGETGEHTHVDEDEEVDPLRLHTAH